METYKLPNGRELQIERDDNPGSPREWDNITRMIFFGNHSGCGDKHPFDADDCDGWDEMEESIKKHYGRGLVHIQKVYAYSHSGMTIALTPFSCPWDSGTLGFVIILREDVVKLMGKKNATKKLIEQAITQVEGEIKTLDQYITGDVYIFSVIDKDGETDECCGGFYGSDIFTNGIIDEMSEEDRVFLKTKVIVLEIDGEWGVYNEGGQLMSEGFFDNEDEAIQFVDDNNEWLLVQLFNVKTK